MGRIDTPDELREYLDEFDILLPLTAEEAEKVLEYIKNSGYTLETDGYGQRKEECQETMDILWGQRMLKLSVKQRMIWA